MVLIISEQNDNVNDSEIFDLLHMLSNIYILNKELSPCIFIFSHTVRQVYSSPSFLNNMSWLDGSAGQSPTASYPPHSSSSSWHSSPFSKASLHPNQHLSPSFLPTVASLSSLKSLRMEPLAPGQDFKENLRLQECVKGERLTPHEGGEEATRLHTPHLVSPTAGRGYSHSPQSHSYTPTHYTAYVPPPQDHSTAAIYLPSSFSPKIRNKMAFFPPGKPTE